MKRIIMVALAFVALLEGHSQYIGGMVPEPWGTCPVVCGGGVFRARVYSMQSWNMLDQPSELVVYADGNPLEILQYSLDEGNTWTDGPPVLSNGNDLNNIILDIDIPTGSLTDGAHNLTHGLANGQMSNEPMSGEGGCNTITYQQPGTVPEMPATLGKWTGYVFDDEGLSECYFDKPYEGIVEINDLNFQNRYSAEGSLVANFPGTAGVHYDYTDLTETYSDYFSVRFMRIEDFEPGVYSVELSFDDGVRLFVDGELLVDNFKENPGADGDVPKLCLDGETELQLDYLQGGWEAWVNVTFTNLGTFDLPEVTYDPICAGESQLPTSTQNPGTYSFNPEPSDGSTIDPTTGEVSIPGGTPPTDYNVEFIETDGECLNAVASTVSSITCSTPSFTIADFCEGANPPAPELNNWVTGGTWDISPVDGTTIDNNGQITGGIGGTTYTIEYTYNDGADQTLSDQVTVNAVDITDFTYLEICEGQNSDAPVLAANFATGGTFDFVTAPTDGASINNSSGVVSNGTGTSSPYSIEYTSAGACPSTFTANLTVQSQDEATFTMEDWCFDDAQSSLPVLGANSTTGGTFAFNPPIGDGAGIDAATGEISNWTQGTEYSVEYTTGGTCPDTYSVVVTTSREEISFSYDPFCANQNSEVPIPGAGFITGGTYAFNNDPGDGAMIDPATGVISNAVYNAGGYNVIYQAPSQCTGQSVSASTQALLLENVEILIHPAQVSICEGADASLTVSATPDPLTYQWEVNDGSGWQALSNDTTYSGVIAYQLDLTTPENAMTSNQYRVEVSNNCGSVISDPATLNVNTFDFEITGNTTICIGETATLEATAGMDSYTWSDLNNVDVVLSSTNILEVTPTEPTTYLLNAAGSGCPANNKTRMIDVIIDPSPNAGPDVEICPGDGVILGTITDASWTYEWFNLTTGEVLGNGMTYFYEGDSAATFQLQATTEEGCSRADQVEVNMMGEMTYYLPNAFSPDDDGKNDLFNVVGEGMTELEGMVFDRWGEPIFEWILGDDGWDGTFNDQPVPPDVYSYKVTLSSQCTKDDVVFGRVSVIR